MYNNRHYLYICTDLLKMHAAFWGGVEVRRSTGLLLLVGLRSTALLSTVARHILFVPINIVLFSPNNALALLGINCFTHSRTSEIETSLDNHEVFACFISIASTTSS